MPIQIKWDALHLRTCGRVKWHAQMMGKKKARNPGYLLYNLYQNSNKRNVITNHKKSETITSWNFDR